MNDLLNIESWRNFKDETGLIYQIPVKKFDDFINSINEKLEEKDDNQLDMFLFEKKEVGPKPHHLI
jgi:hypothetical protein